MVQQAQPPAFTVQRAAQLYRLGDEYVPIDLTTTLTIVAATQRLTAMGVLIDTQPAHVAGITGCTAGPVSRYAETGLFKVTLVLDEPLCAGQEATLAHCTTFNHDEPPSSMNRYGAGSYTIGEVDLQVHFAAAAPPHDAWYELTNQTGDDTPLARGPVKVDVFDINNSTGGFIATHVQANLPPGHWVGIHWSEWEL